MTGSAAERRRDGRHRRRRGDPVRRLAGAGPRPASAVVRRPPASATWPAELSRLSRRTWCPARASGAAAARRPPRSSSGCGCSRRCCGSWSGRAPSGPTLLAIDDAHRADRASLRLAAYVGRRLATPARAARAGPPRGRPARPSWTPCSADLAGRGVTVSDALRCRPISRRRGGRAGPFADARDGPAVDQVVAAAEGNPLLAVEAARAPGRRQRRPARQPAGRRPRHPRPAPGHGPRPGRAPRGGRPSVVAARSCAASGGRRQRPSLSPAPRGLLVRRDGRLGFRHELLAGRRVRRPAGPAGLHDRVADGIDPAEHVERAHHLAAAGRPREAAPAAGGSRRPGARSVGALDEAAELLQGAVAADPADGALWLELEEVYAWAAPAARDGGSLGRGAAAAARRRPAARPGAAAAASSGPSPAIPRSRCAPTAAADLLATPATDPAVRRRH